VAAQIQRLREREKTVMLLDIKRVIFAFWPLPGIRVEPADALIRRAGAAFGQNKRMCGKRSVSISLTRRLP
jgi:hypothetical protein